MTPGIRDLVVAARVADDGVGWANRDAGAAVETCILSDQVFAWSWRDRTDRAFPWAGVAADAVIRDLVEHENLFSASRDRASARASVASEVPVASKRDAAAGRRGSCTRCD